MAVTSTKALILRHLPDREHDRIVVALTPEHGQIRLRARGTKKSVSKLGGSLEPVMEVELTFAAGRVIDQIIGSVIRRRYRDLRQDVISLVMAQWLLELVERVTKPGQAAPELYAVVLENLQAIADQQAETPGRRWLSLYRQGWHILAHEGFAPALTNCAICHRPLEASATRYDPQFGFVHDAEAGPDAWPVQADVHTFLVYGRLSGNERQVWQGLHKLLDDVMLRTLERPLSSQRVLSSIMRQSALSA